MATAITLSAVTKAYQRGGESLRVLDELDLTMQGATFYALMGPSESSYSAPTHRSLRSSSRPSSWL